MAIYGGNTSTPERRCHPRSSVGQPPRLPGTCCTGRSLPRSICLVQAKWMARSLTNQRQFISASSHQEIHYHGNIHSVSMEYKLSLRMNEALIYASIFTGSWTSFCKTVWNWPSHEVNTPFDGQFIMQLPGRAGSQEIQPVVCIRMLLNCLTN